MVQQSTVKQSVYQMFDEVFPEVLKRFCMPKFIHVLIISKDIFTSWVVKTLAIFGKNNKIIL